MNLEPFTFILERVGQLLVDEVKFLSTDKKKLLGRLQQQLELAQSFVRDIEEEKQRATVSHVLETEFQHIMQILPQIEDYLDTLHLEDAQKSQKQSSSQKIKAFFSGTSNPIIRRHVVIDTASQLISDLEDTRKRAESYQRQSNIPQVPRKRRPQTQPNIMNEEFIVGLEEEVRILLTKLAGNSTTILAIAGMGGSGKTTLTRKIYNHQEVKRQFKNQAWVCVSKEWDTSLLVRQICVQLNVPLGESETSTDSCKLREFLQMSASLVVLDDVWEMEALQELLPLLLPGVGKVLVTTRNEEILQYPVRGGVYIHKARALTLEQSWDLFSKIIRSQWQGVRSFDDEAPYAELGREMLRRCHGLPLAIVALAGLLGTKVSIQEWETLKENVSSRILRQNKGFLDYGPVKDMLELSYSDLPYDLKSCFLYLGIYPEDSVIDVSELTHLWIGEGLLRSNLCYEGQTLEEVGVDFVNELAQRCMVQVVVRDYEENVMRIRVHDLFRDLCIDKARELGFFEIVSPSTLPTYSGESMSRRAIIPTSARHWYPKNGSRLRSLIIFADTSRPSVKYELVYEGMKLLRVLDITRVDLRNSELQIGKLILLRHLRIAYCDGAMDLILESVKKLRNLLTFKFEDCGESVMIPNDMVGSMEHLRCLAMGGLSVGPAALGVGRLKSLQSLESCSGEWLCKDLQAESLIQTLRTLVLWGYIESQTQLDAVSDFVGTPSNHLQILDLRISELEFDMKRMKLECCSQLKTLELCGPMREQEGPFFFPPNLLSLTLRGSNIDKGEDLGTALAQLHQLRSLELTNQSYGENYVFNLKSLTMAGLPQLEDLTLRELYCLKEWKIEQGALCQLKYLQLMLCPKLKRIPEGISGIHTLQCLYVFRMSSSFCERLERPSAKEGSITEGGDRGQDFHLISHIPRIRIH